MKKLLEEVFVTEGVPQYTFVKPPNYNEILLDVRRAGKPVIIEGQSGTGKTTCVKKIIEQLLGEVKIPYLSARKPEDIEKIISIANDRPSGTYIIDDFHRLSEHLQTELADIIKIAAEEGGETKLPKLIFIGINQVGASLINLVHDIAKRCGIHRINPGSEDTINALIDKGCSELNITIENKASIYSETRGDYWLTQNLCQTVCSMHDIIETSDKIMNVAYDLPSLRQRVIDKLANSYQKPVKDFCRGNKFRTTNDPYYKLLKVVSEQENSIVDLNRLAAENDWARGSINNIKEQRLRSLIDNKEILARYFFYNVENKLFAIEDPALFYYLQHLNWVTLRNECGFKNEEKQYVYDIAISFAGENRDLARLFAEKLEILDVSVFFDEYYEGNFLGKALTKEFQRIFGEESRIVLCLLDKNHNEKIWPTFEREIFKPRIEEGSIIPIYLDETKFLGIPEDLYGINLKEGYTENNIDDAVIKIAEKLSE